MKCTVLGAHLEGAIRVTVCLLETHIAKRYFLLLRTLMPLRYSI